MLEFPTSNHTCMYSIGLSSPLISCLHTCHWPLSFIIDMTEFSQAVSNSVYQWDIKVGISGRVTILFFISIFSPDPLVSTAKLTCFFFHSFHPYGGLRNLQAFLSPGYSQPQLMEVHDAAIHPGQLLRVQKERKSEKVLYWRNISLYNKNICSVLHS